MKFKMLKKGDYCSVGKDEVRNEYVLENLEGFCDAYYSISEEEFNTFPWSSDMFFKYSSSSRFLCSHTLHGQNLDQLSRLYEKEIDEIGSLLVIGNNTKLYRTNQNEFICIIISDKDLPYDIIGLGNQSILPRLLVERLLGPKYYAARTKIEPTLEELIIDYIKKNPESIKIVGKKT